MSDEQALLAAIWEHPHEDTPRLVYAAWRDDPSQPARAEFIRLQIRAALLNDTDPVRLEIGRRCRSLLAQHTAEWTAPFAWVFADLQPVAWNEDRLSPAVGDA